MTTPVTNSTRDSVDACSCEDFSVTRRSLLKSGAVLGGGMAVTQMFGEAMMQSSFAGTTGGNTMVVISLRGGIDGLGVVVPHGDAGYATNRPNTKVATSELLCKDAMFGLHPKMAALQPLWNAGELAAIQAVGLSVANRSHFSAIEAVEDAAPGTSIRTGWVNRMIGQANPGTHSTFDAVQLGMNFPTAALTGDSPILATSDLKNLQVSGLSSDYTNQRYGSLATAWAGAGGPLASGANEAVSISKGAGKTLSTMADTSASYPSIWNASPFSDPLKQAAKMIRADLGTDVIAIDAGSWDLHTNYGTTAWGGMQSSIEGLSQSLAAFFNDLGSRRSKVTVVTISEFGRRVAENGSQGFDHGWGNMMLVAGAGVRGGQYYGSWPGLGPSQIADGDLKVTTDYRTVLGEVITKRFPNRSLATTFPGFSYSSPLGFMS